VFSPLRTSGEVAQLISGDEDEIDLITMSRLDFAQSLSLRDSNSSCASPDSYKDMVWTPIVERDEEAQTGRHRESRSEVDFREGSKVIMEAFGEGWSVGQETEEEEVLVDVAAQARTKLEAAKRDSILAGY